jgi:hypothetical protein
VNCSATVYKVLRILCCHDLCQRRILFGRNAALFSYVLSFSKGVSVTHTKHKKGEKLFVLHNLASNDVVVCAAAAAVAAIFVQSYVNILWQKYGSRRSNTTVGQTQTTGDSDEVPDWRDNSFSRSQIRHLPDHIMRNMATENQPAQLAVGQPTDGAPAPYDRRLPYNWF